MLFDQKVSLLELRETLPNLFCWSEIKQLWMRPEETGKTNLFSKVGIGVRTTLFSLRKTPGISSHNALRWRGQFYFLTGCQEDGPILETLTAARIEPVPCAAYRQRTEKDDCKRLVHLPEEEIARFPACLTEKYLGYKQEEPMARTETTLVLVTPKAILLETGDLVETGGIRYVVQLCHRLDEYKNEYEINKKADA